MTSMDEIMMRHGTDTATWHRYAPVYDSLFPDRASVLAVMEIGVAEGASIRAWHEIFPNALIVGFDHGPSPTCPRGERLEIHQGSQRDRRAILNAAGERDFDLIIDDASHILADQLCCLFWLWPLLKSGGYYVVEEFDIQDGVGPAGNLASYGLLSGCRTITTPSPNGDELLVVVRKE